MTTADSGPEAVLDSRFSTTNAEPVRWSDALSLLEEAEIYWLATTRQDGQPSVTPLLMVWFDDALVFCTGATEQKGHNLDRNPRVTVTTGNNRYRTGTDVVIEGEVERITDQGSLRGIADLFKRKYDWDFQIKDEGFQGAEDTVAIVYRVKAAKGFAFQRGDEFGQTRWRFG